MLRRPNVWAGRGRGSAAGGASSRLWTPAGGGSIPATPEFAALLSSQGGTPGILTFGFPGDTPPGGWDFENTVGPILSPVISGGRAVYVLCNDVLLVRCELKAQMTAIVPPGSTLTTYIEVVTGGVPLVVGTDVQSSPGGGFVVFTTAIDVHNVPLAPGDIVRGHWVAAGFSPPAGDNYGVNGTYLRVGTGTVNLGTIGNWTGP